MTKHIYFGANLEVVGIMSVFWPQNQQFDLSNWVFVGLLLALAGTFVASLGNMVSERNSLHCIGATQGNILVLYKVTYGACYIVHLA